MRIYLLALNPTDSVTEGFLPAAARLGLDVTVLTDQPAAHRRTHPDIEVLECDVRDHRAVVTRISTHHRPDAVFTNSDHLQTQAALAAAYFGLPAKDWRATLRTKDKAEMRRRLAATGVDTVWSAELTEPVAPSDAPYPCVLKPREGVASEDVVLVDAPEQLVTRAKEILDRRPGAVLVVEEYLPGELYTLETLGDGQVRHVLGGFHTELSAPPYFIEERLTFVPAHPEPVVAQVLAQLDALGVGFGACHTEFVVHEGRARIIEVNYRAIGDQCDLLLARLLEIPLFELVLRTHLGEPLPAHLEARRDGAARLEYPCADRAGTLVQAPDAGELTVAGVHLTYRPLRAMGERHELYRTNRDYLGVLRAVGTDQRTVDRVSAEFLAARSWEIQS
ncbi:MULTISPECIES: acetyl-CoA carboxylase biotin carboxylase subunit family protein [unclassified Streptomyces]|uniref:ATP-grasp domain-containing protein n=1 Tax=unclassified Streptomyces TaxID=2593676 RepID=UPI00225377DD|nr:MULTISPECIES: ATP-grasp domain-containing protein [unclassified Streptomyces]MCX5053804.1 ATP-grasp domain-containing protein [Streptomyces sp. NBC_00474]